MKQLKLMGVSALALTLAASAGFAQDDTFVEDTYLDEIILVGTGLPTEVMDSPASVNVVGEEAIKRVPPSGVAQVLNEVPGVRVNKSGIERISIRGEKTSRVAILIDGQRISDHSEYGTPILISPAAIERIEVVRGPSSVVSGNRAIGGVVNIVTKRGADVPFQLTTSAGYMSATEGWRASANLQGSVGDMDYRLTFSQSELGDRKTPTGTLTPSGIEDRDLSLHLGYGVGNHYFGFRAQDFDLSADVYTGSRAITIDLPQRDMRKYSVFYEGTDLTPWMSSLKMDAYTQTIDRQFTSTATFPNVGTPPAPPPWTWSSITSTSVDEQTTSGFHIKSELDLAAGHRSVVGLEYEDDRLIADKTSTKFDWAAPGVTPPAGPPTTVTALPGVYADATIRALSVYAQHEWAMTDQLTATFGGRYYDVKSDLDVYQVGGVPLPANSNKDGRLLGAVGLAYKPAEDMTLRASISQGYNYPSLLELYLITTAGGVTTLGNPALNPETSTSYEVGMRLDRGSVILDGTLFYTDTKDYIDAVAIAPATAQYQNVSAAKSFGAELGVEFDSGVWGLRPYANLAYMKREYTYANGFSTYDSGTPALSGAVGVRRDWQLGNVYGELDLFVSGESGSKLRDENGVLVRSRTGVLEGYGVFNGFATLNLRGNAQLTDSLELNFEIGNILDREYTMSDQRVGKQGAGRNVSLFLTATF